MRWPVLVGAGVVQEHGDSPEALELMLLASRAAAEDAGSPRLLEDVDHVLTPRGLWSYGDPGDLLAARIGAHARTVLADVGVLQQTLLTRAASLIVEGTADVVLVCGGETRERSVLASRAGREAPETPSTGAVAHETLRPTGEIISRLEIERSLAVPASQYAVIESALRHADGTSVAEHRAEIAALWASANAVATGNGDAWDRGPRTAEEIATATPDNRAVAFPYTRLLCSQWTVNQAAALLVCSEEAARRHGVATDRWVFPLAAAESNAMLPLSHRAALHECRAVAITGERVLELAGVAIDDVAHLDLYSCFPAAVRVQARALGVAPGRDFTVTGGMTFAGGPFNSYLLHAVAKMASVLRADPGSVGLVTSVSGMLTKQGVGLWSTARPANGFAHADLSEEAARATKSVPVVDDHDGPGRVAGYTITHPAHAVAIVDIPGGRRTIAVTDDADLATAMMQEEWCGRPVSVRGNRFSA